MRIGDFLKNVGWESAPLTRFRLGNILTDEVQDLKPLSDITGPLPYSVHEGIETTVKWMQEN